jgi:voltage-gated potassium channel
MIFGSIAILSVEEGNENIKDFEDAVWFSLTTLTISGFGDVYPITTGGRIVAAVLSFVGLGIILGFLSNVGSALNLQDWVRHRRGFHNETKELILNRMQY